MSAFQSISCSFFLQTTLWGTFCNNGTNAGNSNLYVYSNKDPYKQGNRL